MPENPCVITDELLEAFLQCKYKARLRALGRTGQPADFEKHRTSQAQAHRAQVQAKLFPLPKAAPGPESPPALLDAETLKQGQARLQDVRVQSANLAASIDAVELIDVPSALGCFSYRAIQYVREPNPPVSAKLLLAYRSILLGEVQGMVPSSGVMICGPDLEPRQVKLDALEGKVRVLLKELAAQIEGMREAPLVLNSHCAICEFRSGCREEALKIDHLSLLSGISRKEIASFNQKGIFTVNQLSYTFRYRKPAKRAKHPTKPHQHALQALALRMQKVHLHGDFAPPTAPVSVYFDIEGLPEQEFYYLIGALVVQDGKETHHAFWADSPAEQQSIFLQFSRLVAGLAPCKLFHFGRYDSDAIKAMQSGLDEDSGRQMGTALGEATNVLTVIHSHVYFPVYRNSLKEIAGYLGFRWTESEVSGIQSIIFRDTWDASHDPALKERLVRYNREDCQALKTVCDFVSLAASARGKPEAPGAAGPSVVSTDDVARRRSRFVAYGRATFALKDLERVSNCAYFDYQRERVFVRTDKKVAKLVKRAKKKPPAHKPNQVIELTCEKCVLCGSAAIKAGRKVWQRRLTDLRFSASGVKRWVTLYRAGRYACAECGRSFFPEGWPKHKGYFGDQLAAWYVYQNFVCRQTMYQLVESAEELLSIRVPARKAYLFKRRVISRYDSLHEELKQHILKSPVLSIDEGDVTLTKTKGYVWVFTTHDAVWYLYKDTRSGEFLKELLAGYSGVLVSDFYNAYDGINCPQQKCLLHLLRDVNDDLKKNPYDEEFKSIASQFGVVLRRIIDTIDKYGLKRWHLHKHKREAEAFLSGVDARTVSSELALTYQKRLKKVGSKLFTFLDYDGVPWNNNGAEHAVKSFMKFKRTSDGLFSERSLTEALVMLSILETCKLNGVKRLRFLLSEKKDLASILGA
jgi:predicted RecB family nuclease